MFVRLLAVFLLVVNFASPMPIKANLASGSHMHSTEMTAAMHSTVQGDDESGHHETTDGVSFECAMDNCHAVTLASFQSYGRLMIAPKVIVLNDAERPGVKSDFLRPPKA